MGEMVVFPNSLSREEIAVMAKAFLEIQVPRPDYVLKHLVVGCHETLEKQYSQCVLELSIAYDNLRLAQHNVALAELEIKQLSRFSLFSAKRRLQAKIKEIELEKYQRAVLGALREFTSLYNMFQKFPKHFTRQELDAAEPKQWYLRFTRQAAQDIMATGRISQGNQDALRQIGVAPSEVDALMSSIGGNSISAVEQRFLAQGNLKLLVCVPSAEPLKDSEGKPCVPCLNGLKIPGPPAHVHNACGVNTWGGDVAAHYNEAAYMALEENADFLITVETDTFPEPDALIKLLPLALNNPKTAVGAWYPKREHPRQGVHIKLEKGLRQFLPDDGKIHEVYTLAMGCSIFPTQIFRDVKQPWFVTTPKLSQDSYFSQKAREAGYRLLVDTKARAKHIDPITQEIFE